MWSKYPEIEMQLKQIDELIIKNINSRNKLLKTITGELVSAGGKRIRPAFVLLASRFGKYDEDKVLPAAAALELLHTATLVHDDIIDKSELRRGRKTVSESYGTDMAVYTGDFLFTKAVMLLSSRAPLDKLEYVAKAVKIICEGEVDQYLERYNINTSVTSYLKRINRKTAMLFASACALGAGISECPRDIAKHLARFGFYYGMAFQIKDDLNDYVSDAKASGKPVGKDISEGVFTLPLIYAMARNSELRAVVSAFAVSRKIDSATAVTGVVNLVRQSGGLDDTRKMMDKLIDRGLGELDSLPDIKERGIMKELIEGLRHSAQK